MFENLFYRTLSYETGVKMKALKAEEVIKQGRKMMDDSDKAQEY